MSVGAIRAGRAYVEVYGEDGELDKTLKGAETKVNSFGARLASTGRQVASTFGAAIATVGGVGLAAAGAAAGMVTASIAASRMSQSTKTASTDTQQIVDALERLRATGGRAWDYLSLKTSRSSGVFKGIVGMMGEVQRSFQPVIDRFEKMEGHLARMAPAAETAKRTWIQAAAQLGHRLIPTDDNMDSTAYRVGNAARNAAISGQRFAALRGDKEAYAFHSQARVIAEGQRIAAVYSKSLFGGLMLQMSTGAAQLRTSAANGLIALADKLTMGVASKVASGVRSVVAGVSDVGSEAEQSTPKINRMSAAFSRLASGAGTAFSALRRGGAIATGVGGGILAMLSGAAGFDLTTISSRLMNSKSFASGADDLNTRGNAMLMVGDIGNASRLKTAMEGLFQAAEGAWAQIGAAVAPLVTDTLKMVTEWLAGTMRWLNANRDTIQSFFHIASAVAKVGAVAYIASKAFSWVAMLGPAFSLLLTPAGAIIGILAAGVAGWMMFSQSGQQALTKIMSWLRPLYDTFTTTWTGITDAISGGNLALAGQIALDGLQLAFAKTLDSLGLDWATTVNAFNDVWAAGASVISGLQSNLQKYFLMSFDNIGAAWSAMLIDMASSMREEQNSMAKGFLFLAENWKRWREGKKLLLSHETTPELEAMYQSADEERKGLEVEDAKARAENRKKFTPETLKAVGQIDAEKKKKLDEIEAARKAAMKKGDNPQVIADMERELAKLVAQAKANRPAAFTPVIAPDKVSVEKQSVARSASHVGTFNALATVGMVANTGPMQALITLTKEQKKELADWKKIWLAHKKGHAQGPMPLMPVFGANQ